MILKAVFSMTFAFLITTSGVVHATESVVQSTEAQNMFPCVKDNSAYAGVEANDYIEIPNGDKQIRQRFSRHQHCEEASQKLFEASQARSKISLNICGCRVGTWWTGFGTIILPQAVLECTMVTSSGFAQQAEVDTWKKSLDGMDMMQRCEGHRLKIIGE
jgi:hypothetical protein